MSLYFENPVTFPEAGSISVNGIWHPNAPLLAVASFSQDRGGFVIIFDELGESLKDVNYPIHRSYQVTALAWHPEKTVLATGWENGELKVWNGSEKEFINVVGPHKAPITLLDFSEKGGRLVSCDSTGSVVGWKIDSKGDTNMSFHLDLKESVTHLTFRITVKNHPDFDVEGLAKAADVVIVMMEGLTIGYFSVDYQGHLSEMAKVKLSGRVQSRSIGSQGLVWAGNTSELTVRVWDTETNDNYVLPTSLKLYSSDDKSHTVNEIFTCLSYSKLNQTLCAGTNIGRIYFWTKKQNTACTDNPEDSWELNNVNTISGTIKQLMWGSVMLRLPLLSVNFFSEKIWATQKTADQVLLETDKSNYLLQLESQVTDMAIAETILAFTNGRHIVVYEIIWKKNDNGLEKSFSNGSEAEPQPKLVTPVRNLYDMASDFGEIIQAKTNSAGNKVALTLAAANLIPDGKLYIWDIENDDLVVYDFRKYDFPEKDDENEMYETGEHEITLNDNENDAEDIKSAFDEICRNRIPLTLCWDTEDPRLLVCNARKLKMSTEEKKNLKDEDHVIITMFVSSENGIRIHDIKAADPDARLLACVTPHIVTLHKLSIVRDIMSDFNGLEKCDKATRDAVLDFSYNLTLGNMDAAFKAIKLVQSSGVWASLARMCVKTRRLDVAGVCLGHMGNAMAARALRLAVADESLPQEAKVAVLAIHLGMLCERYDLQNKLLRSRNKMDAAHAVAESKDRINLRNTEHAWARTLEQAGDLKEAAARYERANTHLYDVPRMLSDHPQQLQAYMSKTKDKEMLKWWGQYIESQGDMRSALKVYASSGDVYSQVRVLCFLGEEAAATELARANSDKAAYYHMARYYETIGNYEEAVNFFTKATAYCNAVRLCKENSMSEELWNLGIVVSNREKIECAKFFEGLGDLEKAVVLYNRGGMLHKALDLAFKTQQYEVLQEIATQLDSYSDPALVEKCAEYFVTNEQFDKAVDLLAIAKKYKEAINLCLTHNVQLTEDLAEKLTPEKGLVDEEIRVNVLENLAESLMVQGDYHLATKKFTQAGDKIRAMKALLKSGDTEKIIFFAGVSRQREIYIMAANYLQSLDWQNQPEVLRNIITFYSKGKALDLLANFYVACAQVEIDEFQNYEKAFGALTEASRCLQKITNPRDPKQIQRAAEIIQQRLTMVKRFVDIRRTIQMELFLTYLCAAVVLRYCGFHYTLSMTQCRQLLMTGGEELEVAVRRGDIFALMIQHCVKSGNFSDAKQLCGELRQFLNATSSTPITYYLNKDLIEALAQGLGVSVSVIVPVTPKMSVTNNEEVELVEEIIEE
ncbi:hypothetical protein NQ314_015707 [Rhamnusium bicolor]|uniref:Intraflagellar transport protein 140 homolog n=1 Tax=Rhamnusium bicolor TaxID=1586634 RepID=A0AAV8WXH3_9CUCU|nr:hypothetical protein NQ314_015707 [Rhamnusium bicolor]